MAEQKKPKKLFPLIIGVAIIIVVGVVLKLFVFKPFEKRVPGTWEVTNVTIEADTSVVSSDRIESMKRMQKSVYFVLDNDKSMIAYTGGTEINGLWFIDKNKKEVYIRFEASNSQPFLLGKWEHGKLIKVDESAEMVITTTYSKGSGN